MYDEFFSKANALTQQGLPFATATVVRAEKPTSAKPSDRAIITLDGVMHGWIGGSCAQPTVIREALAALADDESRLIRLSTQPNAQSPHEGVKDLPMTCFSGGTLEIYIEPQQPRPSLMIIGTLPVAQALAHLGQAMNYQVIAVDPDSDGTGMGHAHKIVTSLDNLGPLINPLTYIVVATHGNYDEVALERILRQNVAYVGLVSSKRRARAVRDYLKGQGLSEANLLPLHAPAGLDIQARRGDEIALSIMAEIVQKRRNTEALDWLRFHDQEHENARDETAANWDIQPDAQTDKPGAAIDPICHKTVEIATAKFLSIYENEWYYFCCAGCQQTFEQAPEQYVY